MATERQRQGLPEVSPLDLYMDDRRQGRLPDTSDDLYVPLHVAVNIAERPSASRNARRRRHRRQRGSDQHGDMNAWASRNVELWSFQGFEDGAATPQMPTGAARHHMTTRHRRPTHHGHEDQHQAANDHAVEQLRHWDFGDDYPHAAPVAPAHQEPPPAVPHTSAERAREVMRAYFAARALERENAAHLEAAEWDDWANPGGNAAEEERTHQAGLEHDQLMRGWGQPHNGIALFRPYASDDSGTDMRPESEQPLAVSSPQLRRRPARRSPSPPTVNFRRMDIGLDHWRTLGRTRTWSRSSSEASFDSVLLELAETDTLSTRDRARLRRHRCAAAREAERSHE